MKKKVICVLYAQICYKDWQQSSVSPPTDVAAMIQVRPNIFS